MPTNSSYDYAILRVVPHVERGECINVGVILFCRTNRFLGMLTHQDQQRLSILASQLDFLALQQQLEHMEKICHGKKEGGPIGELSQSERFHWLISPRSTIIQSSPVHCGICTNPETELHSLLKKLVTV